MNSLLQPGCVERCPACRFRELTPEESDRKKEDWAKQCLKAVAPRVFPIRAPENRVSYRRKTVLHAREGSAGWEFGMLRRLGRDEEFVSIPDCPQHSPQLNSWLKDLRSLIPSGAPLRFVLASGPILTLVLKIAPDPAWRTLVRSWEAPLTRAGVRALAINWNPSAGRRVLSSRHQEILFGPEFLDEEGLAFGALSFRQQIPSLESEALALAESFLASGEEQAIADLYCGIGASLQRWRQRGWKAVGVELGGEACRMAEKNAPGARVLKGKVEQRLPQLRELLTAPFLVYTNPPRSGHEPEVLRWLLESGPRRVAYLSCNQRSLARDLEILSARYSVCQVHPFDFFPGTDHVESLALLKLTSNS